MKKFIFAVMLLAAALLIASPINVDARGGGHFGGGFRGGGRVIIRGGPGWGWWPWVAGAAILP